MFRLRGSLDVHRSHSNPKDRPSAHSVRLSITLAFLVGFVGSRHALQAETIQLHPIADTTLLESAPDFNMGGEFHVASGTSGSMGDSLRNRGLFRFDLTKIPPQARINTASLAVSVTGIPGRDGGGGPVNSIFSIRRVLRDWGEGDKVGLRGDFATSGEATWNHRFAPNSTGAGGQSWSAPGAAAPTDFLAVASSSQLVAGLSRYTFASTSNLVADVQTWVQNPASNFGWILISDLEARSKTARRFASREDTNNAPILSIDYSVALGPRIERVEINQGVLRFQFVADAGVSSIVQFRESLTSGTWQTLTNPPAQPSSANIVISDPITSQKRFYRVGRM